MRLTRPLALALLLAFAGYAQTKPNFTGNWKLDVAKSDFGMLPPPDSRTDVIEQSDSGIKDAVSSVGQQGPMKFTLDLKTDGTESNIQAGERQLKVSAKWNGPALVVTTKLDYEGNPVTITSNWTLSEDGATWTQAAHIESPMGEMDQKLVFAKDSGTSTASTTAPAAATPVKAAVITAPTTSGPKPNFSGTWKLNVQKSDFGPLPGPESETDVIDHNDPKIKMAVVRKGDQGEQKYDLDLTIDGQEETHKLGDQDIKTTANWDGSALMVLTKLTFQDNDVLIKSAYTLSPDGKTVNVAAHLSSAMGEADQKLVFDKQ